MCRKGCAGEDVRGRVCRGGCAGEDVQGRVWEWYAIDVSVGERQRKCVSPRASRFIIVLERLKEVRVSLTELPLSQVHLTTAL